MEKGEAPYASHLLYTQPDVLYDELPQERQLGINAGYAWGSVCHYHVFYTDFGWSPGMLDALILLCQIGKSFRIRNLSGAPIELPKLETQHQMNRCIDALKLENRSWQE